jgi:hypothetical protein
MMLFRFIDGVMQDRVSLLALTPRLSAWQSLIVKGHQHYLHISRALVARHLTLSLVRAFRFLMLCRQQP